MRPERLLQHFDTISDAPDAVAKLRRLVLNLAVHGKLLEQDAKHQHAVAAVGAESDVNSRDNSPLVPSHWKRTFLGSIGDWGSGSTPPRSDGSLYGGDITWLKSGELGDNRSLRGSAETLTERAIATGSFRKNMPGDVLIAMYGATIGKLAILAEAAVTNQAVCGCTPHVVISNQYLYLFLLANREQFRAASEGGAQPNISKAKIVATPIALPPLEEQHFIVAKVDELMALCDQVDAARTRREAMRDRLAAASLARLNTPDPHSFPDDVRFVLETQTIFPTRPDQIKQFRKTILNLAVRGLLCDQNEAAEPARSLLERLLANGATRAEARLSNLRPTEIYDIPRTWAWAFFGEVVSIESNLVSPSKYETWAHIAPDNIESGTGRLLPYGTVADAGVFSSKHLFRSGCLLYSKIRPALAKVAIADFDGLCSADMYPLRTRMSREYIQLYMLSEVFIAQSVSEDNRVAMPKINQESLSRISVPVPPLEEQIRIVARVGDLMHLCDKLEAALTLADTTRRRLFDALLHESLAPALEAAA
jgi:type I restriction enzyme, S subunit